jgi:hypothetical protein
MTNRHWGIRGDERNPLQVVLRRVAFSRCGKGGRESFVTHRFPIVAAVLDWRVLPPSPRRHDLSSSPPPNPLSGKQHPALVIIKINEKSVISRHVLKV